MRLLKLWLLLAVSIAIAVDEQLTGIDEPTGDYVCTATQFYHVVELELVMRTVVQNKTKPCLDASSSFRCVVTSTHGKPVLMPMMKEKTKKVKVCCAGYYKTEDKHCKPKCYPSCLNGRCVAPGLCECDAGFSGKACSTRLCRPGFWGLACNYMCPLCLNGGVCDSLTGDCSCRPGWQGAHCDLLCPEGKFGSNCTQECGTCPSGEKCDPAIGCCHPNQMNCGTAVQPLKADSGRHSLVATLFFSAAGFLCAALFVLTVVWYCRNYDKMRAAEKTSQVTYRRLVNDVDDENFAQSTSMLEANVPHDKPAPELYTVVENLDDSKCMTV